MTVRFYVRIDRDDGSRTYKGAWSRAHCEREAAAWRESFPALADVRRWARVARPVVDAPRYYPDAVAS
jgi:hypothetical protein